MLGQHPQLYGLPEVNLSTADNVGGLLNMFRRIRPASLHGLLRTIAELEFEEQTDETVAKATRWLEERRSWSTAELFRHIAAKVAPCAIVEKSPTSVAFPHHLQRLHTTFPNARFLQLTRHPRPTCKSIHALISATDAKKGGDRAASVNPERLWNRMNANAFAFLEELPIGQGMHIRGEDLLSDTVLYLRQICNWLGIRDDDDALAAMMHPERSAFARFGPDSARFGNDPNYLENPEFKQRLIPSACLEGPQEWMPSAPVGFSPETRELASYLGYI